MKKNISDLIIDLKEGNKTFLKNNKQILKEFIKGQSPKIAILSCSDSRIVPEFIFNKSIGEIFVIRVAGNVAIDHSVIKSIEYSVEHLKVQYLIILGHTNCGAVFASEKSDDENHKIFNEIKESFILDSDNHFRANILRQLKMLPERSNIVKKHLKNNNLILIGALYDIKTGVVDFILK